MKFSLFLIAAVFGAKQKYVFECQGLVEEAILDRRGALFVKMSYGDGLNLICKTDSVCKQWTSIVMRAAQENKNVIVKYEVTDEAYNCSSLPADQMIVPEYLGISNS